jgi:hypothetical protein
LQLEDAECLAGGADGVYFGVGSWVVAGGDLIRTFRDNVFILNYHSAEGATASGMDVINRELNGASHERVVHVIALLRRDWLLHAHVCNWRTREHISRHGLFRSRFAENGV